MSLSASCGLSGQPVGWRLHAQFCLYSAHSFFPFPLVLSLITSSCAGSCLRNTGNFWGFDREDSGKDWNPELGNVYLRKVWLAKLLRPSTSLFYDIPYLQRSPAMSIFRKIQRREHPELNKLTIGDSSPQIQLKMFVPQGLSDHLLLLPLIQWVITSDDSFKTIIWAKQAIPMGKLRVYVLVKKMPLSLL